MSNRKTNKTETQQMSEVSVDAKEAETPSKKKSHLFKIIGVIEGFVIFLMMLFSVLTIGSNLQPSRSGVAKLPFSNTALFTVRSDSMNPTFRKGDMIYGTIVDYKTYDFRKIEENKSIITFQQTVQDENGKAVNIYNTHRVVKVDVIGDRYFFTTKGDHPDITTSEYIEDEKVVAVYKGKIPVIGTFVNTLQESRVLFFCVIILPLILLFIGNAVYFVRIFYVTGKEEAVEKAISLKEEEMAKIREEARRQALEELKKEQENKKKK